MSYMLTRGDFAGRATFTPFGGSSVRYKPSVNAVKLCAFKPAELAEFADVSCGHVKFSRQLDAVVIASWNLALGFVLRLFPSLKFCKSADSWRQIFNV